MKHAKFGAVVLMSLIVLAGCGLAKTDEQRLIEVDEYMAAGNYRTATIEIKNVLNNNPDNAEARAKLSIVLLGLNDVLGAEKELRRARELGADNHIVNRLQYDIWTAQGQHLEILASLGQVETALSEAEELEYRGAALVAIGNGDAAKPTYEAWMALDPESEDAKVGMARAIAVGGDRELAIEKLNGIVEENPVSVAAWLALGNFNYASGKYAIAEVAYKNSLAQSKPQKNIRRFLFTLTGLADAQLILRKIEPARLTINRLVAYAPNAPQSLLQLSRLAQMDNDFFAAARALNELRLQMPDNIRVLMSLGNVQARLGNYRQAQALFVRVIALAPDNLQARKQLANVQLRQQDTTGAVEVLAPLLAEFGGDADLYGLMAIADMQGGNRGSAVEMLVLAHENSPEDSAITVRLADAHRQNGDAETAVAILENLDASVAAPFARERVLMASLMDIGQTARAMKVGDELVAGHGDDAAALTLVAAFRISADHSGAGRELLEKSRAIDPNNSRTLLALASLELQEGDATTAMQLYQAVYRNDRKNLNALMGLAQISSSNGDIAASIAFLEEARVVFPSAILPKIVLAKMYLAQGRIDDADILAREIAAAGSTNAAAIRETGKVFLETGAVEEAEAQFQLAVDLKPDSVPALLGLARSYMTQGKMEETKQIMESVLAIDPQSRTANAILVLANIRLGNVDQAARQIRNYRESNPNDIVAMAVEGEVFYAMEDYEQAVEAFKSSADGGAGVNAVIREFQSRVKWGADQNPEKPLVDWLAVNPGESRTRAYLAEHYQRSGASDESISEYEILLESSPENSIYLNNLAVEYQRVGELEKALKNAKKANELQPNYAPMMDTLGWIYRDVGQLDKSTRLLSGASRLAPDDGETLYHYAVALSDSGDKEKAKKVLQALIEGDAEFKSRQQAGDLLGEL